MAIAGGGGGTISTVLYFRDGFVRPAPLSQIRPTSMVELDVDRAVERFHGGEDGFAVHAILVGKIVSRLEELGYHSGLKLRPEWRPKP